MNAPIYYPPFYPRPGGLPFYWRDEITGMLPAAVWAYIEHMADHSKPMPSTEQLTLVIIYIGHFINAPCWNAPFGEPTPFVEELTHLRERAKSLQTVRDIAAWIDLAMEIGLDPL